MSDRTARVSPREIADFLATLRSRSTGDGVALLAWKSSLLDRIAQSTADPETHAVAEAARAELAAARSTEQHEAGGL
ncbi:hypothetical protein ACFPZ0_18605 [Streptomonospora nanhaiensis]|uniref:Uncharacterized protein n=1 Tax=Streptomonospora nanhaiensis TaxID=1323731 RepID=A0A853BI14_9ACTN|nr:hypothetical protein [Streptomonospora nanhaiensis]MBX9390124.1 hypothetical protein [Streptomonospora nanhaiensis]NYI94660.1 hypothetical protein [Streptomonospora nanhaiensis]